ncbi:putative beta-N-hexosaminidase [Xylaria bambusicola]|uniref:putative beta-N-hexosaminidase n=1 Tax=Xylaria bambusicola TaxID=326684 RepID=UPI0020082D89|nr:putative beta-N-hexosaminidase [Xylaria bambusicola]KAI0515173.1 putative beta-N-hexosaminidase [Xylaria bambusicola]
MYRRLWLLLPGVVASSLQLLPPISPSPRNETTPGLTLDSVLTTVYIVESLASHRDGQGLTLIPPSGLEFARTFIEDLEEASGKPWTLHVVSASPTNVTGIVLDQFHGDPLSLSYEDGSPTEEGYTLEIENNRAVISGSGARGMWWGTRTLLQQLIISGWTTLPASRITDAPAYATRGFMLDAGRKWYSPSFLKDLCTYASFFKMSEFQYHTSDNYPLNRGHNDTWNEVYSQFSLHPESEDLQGLIQRENETLTRSDFDDLQRHCAGRGITIVPEIEAPGHCLSITKWKPELSLSKRDLLNLTHPDSIPTVKRIWEEFLPWFQSKEVHIGADEYDSTLADDYISFVNELSVFVNSTSAKRVRIWGTYEPSTTATIDSSVIIQHWQYGQSDPVELYNSGYDLINTEDWWAYMSIKNDHMPILPAPYPQFFNGTRVLNFAGCSGWQWEPALFNPVNTTEQLPAGAAENKGAILAAWNDNGPDASTQLEAYYAMRRGIPLAGARAWSGSRGPKLEASSIEKSISLLAAQAPGQNLDRRLNNTASQDNKSGQQHPLISWTRSRNNSDGVSHLGHGSKGVNYTLTLDVTGPFRLSSEDVTLKLDEGKDGGVLTFVADGWEYPLRSVAEADGFDEGHPGRIWANVTSSTHTPVPLTLPAKVTITSDVIGGSRAYVNDTFAGRFEVFVFGGRNTVFSWSQMAFVAPLDRLESGDAGGGGIERLALWDGVRGDGGPVTSGAGEGYVRTGRGYMLGSVLVVLGGWIWVI